MRTPARRDDVVEDADVRHRWRAADVPVRLGAEPPGQGRVVEQRREGPAPGRDVRRVDEQAAATVASVPRSPPMEAATTAAPADIASSATAPSGSGHCDGIVTTSDRRNSSSVPS